MSSIYGTIDAGRAGLITFMPEGKGEEKLDAASADVIPQGAFIFRDVANVTPADRVWKLPGTAGSQEGPWGICTKAKPAGETKVTGVWGAGFEGTVIASDAIAPESTIIASTTDDGQVEQSADGTGPARYLRRYKYANDGDGNHAKVAAADGDVIVIKLL